MVQLLEQGRVELVSSPVSDLIDESETTLTPTPTPTLTMTASSPASPASSTSPEIRIPADYEFTVSALVKDEKRFVFGWDYSSRLDTNILEASARAKSIAWILQVNAFHGFQPQTAYSSIHYLDRFLSERQFPIANGWPYQLLAVACLSVAAKMEELLVPSLIDLQMEGVVAEQIFEPKTVERMELLVLNLLGWKLRLVTPFDFLDLFACKMDGMGSRSGFYALQAGDNILSAMEEPRLLQYRPSCIAAAALLYVANKTQSLSHVDSETAESWGVGLSREKIASCCRILHENVLSKSPIQNELLPDLECSSPSFSESSSCSSSPSNSSKRRKLCGNNLWT